MDQNKLLRDEKLKSFLGRSNLEHIIPPCGYFISLWYLHQTDISWL